MAKARQALRQRREQLGLTQEEVAHAIGVATTTYRDWELGVTTPRVGFRPRIARGLRVSLPEAGWMLDGNGQPMVADGMAVPEWLGHLAALEQGAVAIWTFEPMVVPGLLQVASYATAVERADPELLSDDGIARRVAARMARQGVLDRRPDPLALSVVLDESVLHRVAGDGEIMAEQLEHLAEMAGRDTIDVRVLPLDAGVFAAAFGAFSVFTSPRATKPYMACVEDRVGPHYLDRDHDVAAHVQLFSYLLSVSLSPVASIDLIRTLIKERYT